MTSEEYARQYHAKRVRQRYDMLLSEHRCTQCGKQDDRTLAGRTRCEVCNAKAYKPRQLTEQQKANDRVRSKAKRLERINACQCRECGKQDYMTLHGKQLCATCQRKCNQKNKAYAESGKRFANYKRCTEERMAKGLCVKCGRNEPEAGRKRCIDCLVRERIYKRKYRAIINGMGV